MKTFLEKSVSLFFALTIATGCGKSFKEDAPDNLPTPVPPSVPKENTSQTETPRRVLVALPRFETRIAKEPSGRIESVISPSVDTPYTIFRSKEDEFGNFVLLAKNVVGTYRDAWPEGVLSYNYKIGVYTSPTNFQSVDTWWAYDFVLPDLGIEIPDLCDESEEKFTDSN